MNMPAKSTTEQNPVDFDRTGGVPAVAPMQGVERVFGAQRVQVYRNDEKVLAKLKTLAAAAGEHWYYRYPVKNRQTNSTDWIEGPSIKLANDVARVFGNCDVDTRVIDLGDSWLFYARFIDLETGYSLTRPFQQRKAQVSVNTRDPGRAQDIAFQIGCSKAIRNVVCNALQTFADFGFEEARNSLVKKVDGDLDGWRKRTIEGLGRIPVAVKRAELVLGRASKDWLAPDVARVIAMMKAIADGMATVDETFPDPDAKPAEEPAQKDASPRGETVADTLDRFAGGGGEGASPGAEAGTQTEKQETSADVSTQPAETPGDDKSKTAAADQQKAAEPSKSNDKDLLGDQPAGPPTDAASYKRFAEHAIANFRTAANLKTWWASDAQKKMRTACKLEKADVDEVAAMVDAAAEKLTPKK